MNLEQIDTSTTAGKAEVMRLAAEGREVAFRVKDSDNWWDCDEPAWGWNDHDYAIIAEPVGPDEVWVEFDKQGDIISVWRHRDGSGVNGRTRERYVRADQ